MKAIVKDAAAIASLKPINLIGYLKARGWQKYSEVSGIYSVWHNPNFSDAEILIPFRRDAADFVTRLSEVISELELVENRSQIEIIKDLHNSGFDIVRLRAQVRSASDGTIKLDDGVIMFTQAKESVLAAACATIQPRAYYHARKPQQANEYMDRVRLGQTEHGSYVLTILSPVAPQLAAHSDTDLFPEDPFERKVVMTLSRSINLVVDAAQRANIEQNFEPFQEAVSQGVSANLCEAIAGLFKIDEARAFDVSVAWAQNRPESTGIPIRTLLSDDIVPTIEEAARLFRARQTLDDYLVEGTVIKLERGDREPTGKATIFGMVEDSMRKISITLSGHDYDNAVQAHGDRRPVKVVGNIIKDGRNYRIDNPTIFEVPEED